MMKASKNVHRWRPLVGVIAVGALAFGLSIRLEGAPVPGGAGKASDRVVGVTAKEVKAARAVSRIDRISGIPQHNGQTVTFGNLTNRLSGDVPIMPVTVVDYRDDEGTRMRDAGLLVGPLPMPTRLQGGVAAVGTACLSICTGAGTPLACCTGVGTGTCVCCSFAVDCDDGNPCTKDACNLEPGDTEDTGICANDPAPSGGDGSVGSTLCEANFGLACLGCDDGLYCNGLETCVAGVCTPGADPCPTSVCSESLNLCHTQCTNDAAGNVFCQSLNATTVLFCNGSETCVGGVCQAGVNPCGTGAVCGERKCTNTEPDTHACITDQDCAAYNSGDSFCTIDGPICAPGRCCQPDGADGDSEPDCTKRTLAACSALAPAGLFYPGDKGSYPESGGNLCPIESKIQIKCPKYASGIGPSGPFTHLFGPVSDSPRVRICIGGDNGGATCTTSGNCTGGGTCSPLNKLGDDYTMTNDPGFISLDFLRFAGGSIVTDRINFEFYDESGNFVEDFLFSSLEAFGVYPVAFEPPIVIPSGGYVVMSTASHFSAEAMHAWAGTDAVDVGANVDTKLWINGGPTTVSSSLGILAYELVGLNTTGPSGACCDPDTLGCDNAQLRWDCLAANKSYLGDGTKCAACDTGPSANQYCRRCSNDANQSCDKNSDCGGINTCIPTNSACDQSLGAATCVAEPACGVGACCSPTLGTCTVIDETTCTNGGGNYQGHGTDCDADNGYDESRLGASPQHCCPQPAMTGADNCEDVTLHVIPALAPGETIVVTITGNNTPATSTIAAPDSCNQLAAPSADPDAEPGWWEGFTLEGGCTMLYLTYCCSDPVHYGVYIHIYNSCPCSGLIGSSANPYAPYYRAAEESPFFRGKPYCAEDDNLWQSFPFLKAGTYWHPVHSQLSAVHGAYQINLVATGCPTAACCQGDACTDGVNQLECDAMEGYFLAPPQKYPTVAACTDASAPCDAGSCCKGPGDCFDADVGGQPVNPGDCNLAGQTYVGGVRCHGGTCSADASVSCSSTADCAAVAAGQCLGDAQLLSQPSPCPICEIEGADNCQLYDSGSRNSTLSDRHLTTTGLLSADDFTPTGDTLSTVCVWGFYLNGDPDAPPVEFDCSPFVLTDKFRVRVYTNDPSNGRMPGTVVVGGESMATSIRAEVSNSLADLLEVKGYGYQLTLDNSISLTVGTTYWLEVSNDAGVQAAPQCNWFRMQKSPRTPTSYSFGGNDTGYEPGFETPFDEAFCTNLGLTTSTIGNVLGGCCLCDGTCTLLTLSDCSTINGIWHVNNPTCSGVTCPAAPGRPFNDDCDMVGGPPFIEAGTYIVSNQCASTDGYGPIASDLGGTTDLDFDVWFYYRAPPGSECPLVVTMCGTGLAFDSMLAVYSNCPAPGDPGTCDVTQCPPCPLTSEISALTLAGTGQDESCTGAAVGGPGIWKSAEQILRDAKPNECFLLRIGSFPGSRGTSSTTVSCGIIGAAPPDLVADPTGIAKSRFISFKFPKNADCAAATTPYACCTGIGTGTCDTAGTTALRVSWPTGFLHKLSPGYPVYTNGSNLPIPFTLFDGTPLWVGPPASYTEGSGDPTTFMASKLQCTPYYQDWSTVGLLHVTGEMILPSSAYNVEHLAVSCLNNEPACPAVSAPLAISTACSANVVVSPPSDTLFVKANFGDITSLVDKYGGVKPGRPIKARSKIGTTNKRGLINITPPVGFTDIPVCVDGYQGKPYPYKPGKCSGAQTTECRDDGGCIGTGPCILCP